MKKLASLLPVALAAFTLSLQAQVAAGLGGITGVVTDPSGATISSAEVSVDNEALSIHRKITTGGGGVFNAPALVPNPGYRVTVKAPGFSLFENRNITILVGQNVNVRARLDVENASPASRSLTKHPSLKARSMYRKTSPKHKSTIYPSRAAASIPLSCSHPPSSPMAASAC